MKKKRKIIAVILIVLSVLATQFSVLIQETKAAVTTGAVNSTINWSFDDATGKITFSGTGELTRVWVNSIPTYATVITSVEIGQGITSIGNQTFYGYTNLASITIPNSVTSIGEFAFAECTSLASITIPNSVTTIGGGAFKNCTSLTSITIPNSITKVSGSMFLNCTSLASITIPSSVTSIEEFAFAECTSLASITIPNSVTTIGGGAFKNCTSLTSITIPNSITKVSGSMFLNCTSLASITIPSSVTSIEEFAFAGSTRLTSITIPNSVTSIGSMAFYKCIRLANITLPKSVTTIKSSSFNECVTLKNINVSSENEAFCSINGVLFSKDKTKLIRYPINREQELYVVPESVTTILNYAFEGTLLKKLVILKKDIIWGENVFSDDMDVTFCIKRNAALPVLSDTSDLSFEIDEAGPTVSVENNGFKIGVTAVDEGSGLAETPYSIDGETYQKDFNFTVTENGKYTIYARDNMGNITTKTIEINVDEESEVAGTTDKIEETAETSTTKLPKTGTTSIGIALIIFVGIAIIANKKMKKYSI